MTISDNCPKSEKDETEWCGLSFVKPIVHNFFV